MPGYHLSDIPRGQLGQFSKVQEEFLEFCDAMEQKSHVMALVELSDLVGSIYFHMLEEGYLKEWGHVISVDNSPAVSCEEVKKVFAILGPHVSLNDYKYFFNVLNCYMLNYNLHLEDLIAMSQITQRVFQNGYRQSR